MQRWIAFGIAVFLSTALIFHWVPGFHNWKVTNYFWINFDSPFTGLFVLALNLPLLRSRQQWTQMATKAIPLTVLGIALMICLAMLTGPVSWDPKLPSHFVLRILTNLMFVVIPEEGFFRGFVQEELYNRFGKGAMGNIGAVLVTAAFFTLVHLKWTGSLPLMGFVFLAGILYGSIYQYTKTIESSILCHFALNLTHMIFFTYHAM